MNLNFTGNENWPSRITRNNPVYLDAARDPLDGWALGNGHIGALLWCDESRLYCALNRADYWTDGGVAELYNWKFEEEESLPTLLQAGTVTIDFGLPVFDTAYLISFRAELDLATGSLHGEAVSVWGKITWDALAGENSDSVRIVWCAELSEASRPSIRVGRFGSRTYCHWYAQIHNRPEIGLADTNTLKIPGGALVGDRVARGRFAVGVSCFAGLNNRVLDMQCVNRFECAAVPLKKNERHELALILGAPGDDDGGKMAGRLAAERAIPYAQRHAENETAWRTFWDRSHLSSSDAYSDAVWHLHMYYANAGQRGSVPGRFIGGLWGWYHDFQAWGFFFHWNQQMIYWSLETAGHAELSRNYLLWRGRATAINRDYAQKLFQRPGGWTSDVCDWRGRPSIGEAANHTPQAMIALDFYRNYLYTGDREFLRREALPYMIDAALFLAGGLHEGADGKLHVAEATSGEGWILCQDTHIELASLRALLPAVLEAQRILGECDPRTANFAEILANLTPFPVMELETAGAKLPWRGAKRFAAGIRADDGRLTAAFSPSTNPESGWIEFAAQNMERRLAPPVPNLRPTPVCVDGIFPSSDILAVFPCNLIGLAQQGTAEFDLAWNTVLATLSDHGYTVWDPELIFLARMGMGEEFQRLLDGFLSSWQCLANGWFTDVIKREALFIRGESRIKDQAAENTAKRPIRSWPFRHLGWEGLGVTACALNERLLQSHDGTIRLIPAVTADFSARFTLYAAGGHRVSAEVEAGKIRWAAIELGYIAGAQVVNPWPEAQLTAPDGKISLQKGERITLAGKPGEVWILQDGKNPARIDIQIPVEVSDVKYHKGGVARIGIPQLF